MPYIDSHKHYLNLLSRRDEKDELIEKIAMTYPALFNKYRSEIRELVKLGVLRKVPESSNKLLQAILDLRQLKMLFPASWKKRLIGLRSKYA